jgi:hypothetical protein
MPLSLLSVPQQHDTPTCLPAFVLQGHSPADVQLLMGLCLNFNKLNGNDFLASGQQAAQLYEVPKIVALFKQLDFLGLSSYPTVGVGE